MSLLYIVLVEMVQVKPHYLFVHHYPLSREQDLELHLSLLLLILYYKSCPQHKFSAGIRTLPLTKLQFCIPIEIVIKRSPSFLSLDIQLHIYIFNQVFPQFHMLNWTHSPKTKIIYDSSICKHMFKFINVSSCMWKNLRLIHIK